MIHACAPTGVRRTRRRLSVAAVAFPAFILLLALAGCAGLRPSEEFTPEKGVGYLSVNGTRLFCEAAGAGEPVVFLHGFALDSRMWDPQFAALAARFRVIRYDLRGYGRSALPRAGSQYSQLDDLLALLDRLGVAGPVHLVGQGMGGRYALEFALLHPERVKSLALLDPVVDGWAWSREWLDAYKPVFEAARRGDVAGAKQAWETHPLFAPIRERPAAAARFAQMIGDYSGWHFVNIDPSQRLAPAALTQLGRMRVPTLVMVGERDWPDLKRIADRLAGGIAGAQRVVVPGAGHLVGMEIPDEVNRRLADFLASVK